MVQLEERSAKEIPQIRGGDGRASRTAMRLHATGISNDLPSDHKLPRRFTVNDLLLPPIIAGTVTASAMVTSAVADMDIWSNVGQVLNAFKSGHIALGSMLFLIVLAAAASKYGASRLAFLRGSAGRALVLLVGAFGTAGAVALSDGSPLTTSVLMGALTVAIQSAGGYSLIKSLIIEPLEPYVAKGPAWLQAIFRVVAWVFIKKADPIVEAEKAGNAAVKENPPQPLKFTDVP